MNRAAPMRDPHAVRRQGEIAEQVALFDWVAWVGVKEHPDLAWLLHIPNGGYRRPREAAELQAMGVKAGVPDLLLPVSRRGYHALFVELKTSVGYVSSAQRAWHAWLTSQGYCVRVCRGWEAARDVLLWYLGGTP